MKVESDGRISLSGPLSRNDSLKGLSIGDTIEVRVLERIAPDRALIDLKGNKVQAQFSAPVPDSGKFVLTLTNVTRDSLRFTLRNTSAPGSFLNMTMFDGMVVPLARIRELMIAINSRSIGLFDLSLILRGSKEDAGAESRKCVLSQLLSRGFDPEKIPVASAILSGVPEREIPAILSLLDFADPRHDDREDQQGFFRDQVLEQGDIGSLAVRPDENSVKTVFFMRDGELRKFRWLSDEHSFAGMIETPNLGRLDFVIRRREGCYTTIMCDERIEAHLAEGLPDLMDSLSAHYGKTSIQLLSLRELREKVIAFTAEMGNHTFDVTV